MHGMKISVVGEGAYTLLQKLSTHSDYSVSDNGFIHQIALKNNYMRQSVLMSVHR
jgi:hypothetical protein